MVEASSSLSGDAEALPGSLGLRTSVPNVRLNQASRGPTKHAAIVRVNAFVEADEDQGDPN